MKRRRSLTNCIFIITAFFLACTTNTVCQTVRYLTISQFLSFKNLDPTLTVSLTDLCKMIANCQSFIMIQESLFLPALTHCTVVQLVSIFVAFCFLTGFILKECLSYTSITPMKLCFTLWHTWKLD